MDERSELESYHRPQVDSKEEFQTKIVHILRTQTEVQPVIVPHGLQFNTTLHVAMPLQTTLFTSSSTHENYVAIYGAGPENGVCIWNKEKIEMKMRKRKKSLDCRITHFLYISSCYIFFAACDDLTIRTYGSQFREYSRLQLQHSILSMLYDEEHSYIVTGCLGFVQQWKLNNGLHTPPIMLKQMHLKDHVSGVTPWLSFLYKDKQRNQIVALTETAIFFLDAASLNLMSFLENRHAFPLTVCLTYLPRQYLITGIRPLCFSKVTI